MSVLGGVPSQRDEYLLPHQVPCRGMSTPPYIPNPRHTPLRIYTHSPGRDLRPGTPPLPWTDKLVKNYLSATLLEFSKNLSLLTRFSLYNRAPSFFLIYKQHVTLLPITYGSLTWWEPYVDIVGINIILHTVFTMFVNFTNWVHYYFEITLSVRTARTDMFTDKNTRWTIIPS